MESPKARKLSGSSTSIQEKDKFETPPKQIRRSRGGSSEPRPSPQASPAVKDPPVTKLDLETITDKPVIDTYELEPKLKKLMKQVNP